MSEKAQEELKERILSERDKGNIVFQALPGEFMCVPVAEFVKQPADGMLYDLNRLEEVALTFIGEPKWVNDFAVAMVIRELVKQRDAALRGELYVPLPVWNIPDCPYPNWPYAEREAWKSGYNDALRHVHDISPREVSK